MFVLKRQYRVPVRCTASSHHTVEETLSVGVLSISRLK